MIYVMWREEYLWNISVLQKVHLSNLVCNVSHVSLCIMKNISLFTENTFVNAISICQ
jgi:hypothetical protein